MSHYRTKAGTLCKMIQVEAPGVEKLTTKDHLSASVQGHWAMDVRGNKKKKPGTDLLRECKELSEKDRLLPADSPEEVLVTASDSCRYGKFNEMFQVELNFKRSMYTTRIGPIDGIFYLLLEEEEQQEDEETSSDEDD